jgi:hypothetical protein
MSASMRTVNRNRSQQRNWESNCGAPGEGLPDGGAGGAKP